MPTISRGFVAIKSASAGDAMPPQCEIIEVRVAEIQRLFRAIDPSPFGTRQLDPGAEEFIVHRAGEVPGAVPIGLMVYVDRPAGAGDDAVVSKNGVHQFFRRRGEAARRELGDLFRRGRISLVIGLAFLGGSSGLAQALGGTLDGGGLGGFLRESVIIGGWVAMWRPLEVFLYDWWPIRAQAKLYDRLAAMPVGIQYAPLGKSRDSATPPRSIVDEVIDDRGTRP
jgi:hypothetical protein